MFPDNRGLPKSAVDRVWACIASIRVALEAVRYATAGAAREATDAIDLAARQLELLADLADELEACDGEDSCYGRAGI